MPAKAGILVLCMANVCRSVYATSLLEHGLAGSGIAVESAGLASPDGRSPCALVCSRTSLAGLQAPSGFSKQVRPEDLEEPDLVLVMTTFQRTAVARMLPSARRKTMTLIEAALVSSALRTAGVRTESLAEYVDQLDRHRSGVPLPLVHDVRLVFGLFPVKTPQGRPDITIEDGHVSPERGDHERSLDQVQHNVNRLLAAWEVQPWLGDPQALDETR